MQFMNGCDENTRMLFTYKLCALTNVLIVLKDGN
jgi:hypothetical protein